MSPESFSVYALKHRDSGRYYFGQTNGTAGTRWREHVHAAGNLSRNRTPIACAIAEYGADAFDVIPMLCNLTKAAADEWERCMVERFGEAGTFNAVFTQRASRRMSNLKRGTKASEETKRKQSEAHRRRWADMPAERRAALIQARADAGAAARKGLRRVRTEDGVRYVPWGDEDPIEVRRAAWRRKAAYARNRRKALKGSSDG